jgi:hypothetical protein
MPLNHDNNYTYHRPPAEIVPVFQAIRDTAKCLAMLIDESCPDTRERSIAHTHIETAVMWANAAIARQYPAE